MTSVENKMELVKLINEWNSSRYDLFAISLPNDNLEFHGVMRFYFQDAGEKVSTKCVRVDSTASTDDVIKVLIEKFRPDMKTLSSARDYAIYEVHADSQERRLKPSERPLWIQLDWCKDGSEGRFLLKNEHAKTVQFETSVNGTLKNNTTQQQQQQSSKQSLLGKIKKSDQKSSKGGSVSKATAATADDLYKQLPDNKFTRSISNPEAVMARRRKQKLENKLNQIKSKDGGGTLKIYGEILNPNVPYKTLLLSNFDTADFVVKETLEKYGLPNEDPNNYCLVQVVVPSKEDREKNGAQVKEYIIQDDSCPLAILLDHAHYLDKNDGSAVMFQIRRCTPDLLEARKLKSKQSPQRKQEEKPSSLAISKQAQSQELSPSDQTYVVSKLPILVELNYDGHDLKSPRVIQIKSDFYEFGNDRHLAMTHALNYILLDAPVPGIEKKHCAIKKSNDNLQLLLIPFAETYVNDVPVREPTQLFNNFTVRLGKYTLFRVENPNEAQCNLIVATNQQSLAPSTKRTQSLKCAKPLISNSNSNNYVPANYETLYDNEQLFYNQLQDHLTNSQKSKANKPTPEGLPGLLEFPDDGEDALLSQICSTNEQTLLWPFKLAPVYTIYMMLRYRLSQKYKSDQMSFSDKMNSCSLLILKIVNYIREAVDVNHLDRSILPYWLANASELLYFLKQDIHLSQISFDAQELLADCVQTCFKYLVNLLQSQLDLLIPAFLDPSDHVELDTGDYLIDRPMIKHMIQLFEETMNLLRMTRVNASITIQLFSSLFYYINGRLFNCLINDHISKNGYISRYWGNKILRRMSKIHVWSEKQGLELAADVHLSKIVQAAQFLKSPKHDLNNISLISSHCFSLNSLQIRYFIRNYKLDMNEMPLNAQLCNNFVSIAENTADQLLRQEGRAVKLDEDVELCLPFLLPNDGYSSDIIKGLPPGQIDYLMNLQNIGFCWLWQNTQSPGNWKRYFITPLSSSATSPSNNSTASSASVSRQTSSAASSSAHHRAVPPPNPFPFPLSNNINNYVDSATSNNRLLMSNQPQQHHHLLQQQQQPPPPPPIAHSPALVSQKVEPTLASITISKIGNSLGFSIVAGKPVNSIDYGIYVKSIIYGGAAHQDGRLEVGDQILSVNGISLVNVMQINAAEILLQCGQQANFLVSKKAAFYNGLDSLLLNDYDTSSQLSGSSSSATNDTAKFSTLQRYPSRPKAQPTMNASSTLPRNYLSSRSFNHGSNYINQPMIENFQMPTFRTHQTLTTATSEKKSVLLYENDKLSNAIQPTPLSNSRQMSADLTRKLVSSAESKLVIPSNPTHMKSTHSNMRLLDKNKFAKQAPIIESDELTSENLNSIDSNTSKSIDNKEKIANFILSQADKPNEEIKTYENDLLVMSAQKEPTSQQTMKSSTSSIGSARNESPNKSATQSSASLSSPSNSMRSSSQVNQIDDDAALMPPPPPPPPVDEMQSLRLSIEQQENDQNDQGNRMLSELLHSNRHFESTESLNKCPDTPKVIGKNELYLDPLMNRKQERIKSEQQKENISLEGEKLSFKDKLKLFASKNSSSSLDENKIRPMSSKMNLK